MPIVLAHLGPKVPLNFRDTHESSSSSSGSGGGLHPAPALAFIARRWRPTGLSSPPPYSVGGRILGSDDWTELHIVLYRGGSLWAELEALTTDKGTTACPTDHHPRDIRRTPRLRHHPNPRHRPINGHLNTRSCTEPPRRPGNSRQLCLGIQQNPLLGRLSAAIYSWGSQWQVSPFHSDCCHLGGSQGCCHRVWRACPARSPRNFTRPGPLPDPCWPWRVSPGRPAAWQ